MTSLKRKAPEGLLPTYSTKQARTTRHRYTGENSSPNQNEGLGARWAVLLADTFHSFMGPFMKALSAQPPAVATTPRPVSPSTPVSPLNVPLPPSPPRSPPRHRRKSVEERGGGSSHPPPPTVSSSSSPNSGHTLTHVNDGYSHGKDAPSIATSYPPPLATSSTFPTPYPKVDVAFGDAERRRVDSGSRARPPKGLVSSSTFPTLYPDIDAAFGDAGRRRVSRVSSGSHVRPPNRENSREKTRNEKDPKDASSFASSSTISYPEIDAAFGDARRRVSSGSRARAPKREHIFEKTHKENVQSTRKKDREELVKELYQLRRSSGYSSDMSTFESYLQYRAKLEMLDRRDYLSPSPSLTDLRTKPVTPQRTRRHSISVDVTYGFLERALEKARQTLNSPKPPKPFVPTLEQLQISARFKDEQIDRLLRGPQLPSSLPPEEDAQVDSILARRGVVSSFAREQVTDKDVWRLKPGQWLNDEIINFYGAMILARADSSKENPAANGVAKGGRSGKRKGKPLNAHYFSSFFWSKLKGEGYEKARLGKWTKKFDIFEKDIILIPVNHNNAHWTAAAINFRRKRIESYDSMGMPRQTLLRNYLDAEHRNKKKKPFDFTGWEDHVPEDTPQQENGFDCGVFTCQFLESLSRGEEKFNFSQDNMTYLRRRMIWEIGNAKLKDDL
ncbi:hypothetical protein JAAARDRAFT_196153 [Jaapia argillacea MUCL 33604]|uniref:Ubiquitin-like protease family profile domain-containing protein n=1 Tax=Jaapia argillacea MUCL 33604 TaxID=933084 RepID=A0A067PIK0_9AGAM|nr:hypothetical protein JAAARDRAFT_196153 [Jaapia argillacea MUCL 33604]